MFLLLAKQRFGAFNFLEDVGVVIFCFCEGFHISLLRFASKITSKVYK